MVEPHYFFSALAQSSAAVAGFVVAIAVALYSLERQKIERRTDEYRDALLELRNRYGFPLRTLSGMLNNEGGNELEDSLDLAIRREELEEIAYEESEDYPVTSLFLAHVERMLQLLTRISPENDYLLSADELDALQGSVHWFHDNFYQINSTSSALIEEITGKPYTEFKNVAAIRIFERHDEELTGFNAFQLREWFNERSQVEPEVMRPRFENRGEGRRDLDDEFLTGDSFWTLKSLAEYLTHDFRRVRRESSGTVIRYQSGIRPVVKVATYLILIGVFLPMAFLFSSPITLPAWAILGSQIVLLGAALLLSLTLVEIVVRSAGASNQMGDIESLSRYSTVIVQKLPELPT